MIGVRLLYPTQYTALNKQIKIPKNSHITLWKSKSLLMHFIRWKALKCIHYYYAIGISLENYDLIRENAK